MLKNTISLECKVNDKNFLFLSDNNASIAEVKECLFQFVKYVGDLEESAKQSSKVEELKQESEPEKQEENNG